MRVIVKEPGKASKVKEIENALAAFQKAVGGYIEVVYPSRKIFESDVLIVCNKEGKLLDLPFNFLLGRDYIAGTAIFVGDDQTAISDH